MLGRTKNTSQLRFCSWETLKGMILIKKVELYPLYNFYHILSAAHNAGLNAHLGYYISPLPLYVLFFSFINYLFCSCAHVCICLRKLGKYVEQSVSFVFPQHVCSVELWSSILSKAFSCWTLQPAHLTHSDSLTLSISISVTFYRLGSFFFSGTSLFCFALLVPFDIFVGKDVNKCLYTYTNQKIWFCLSLA